MSLRNTSPEKVGVIGAGSFGTTVANLAARNKPTLLFIRNPELLKEADEKGTIRGINLHENIEFTNDLEKLCKESYLVFPIVPSSDMRLLIRSVNQLLTPGHLVIHGTKGFDWEFDEQVDEEVRLADVKTMSTVIREESSAVRIGCIAGPNLAAELQQDLPAGTVIASKFNDVITEGRAVLRNELFQVYGSNDLLGIELAGILKNYIAILSGALHELKMGENATALLISRGLSEIVYIGQALGAQPRSFLGVAGIGDMVATCYSSHSRNFNVGVKLAQGESIQEIADGMNEVAEGIKTVKIVNTLSEKRNLKTPIASALYKSMFEQVPLDKTVRILMRIPPQQDAAFVEDVM